MRPTLLIADLHLSEQAPALDAAFTAFLAAAGAAEAEALYILGDLFDYYLGDDLLTPYQASVRARLEALPLPVYVLSGNRDFLLGPAFARGNIRLLPERFSPRPGVLLEHGDLLCSDDIGYQRLRWLLRRPVLQRLYFALPRAWKQRLAARLRRSSRGKRCDRTDVNENTAEAAMRAAGATVLIHGHTHRPGVHRNGQGERFVLGDWQPNGIVMLCYDWRQFQLRDSADFIQ